MTTRNAVAPPVRTGLRAMKSPAAMASAEADVKKKWRSRDPRLRRFAGLRIFLLPDFVVLPVMSPFSLVTVHVDHRAQLWAQLWAKFLMFVFSHDKLRTCHRKADSDDRAFAGAAFQLHRSLMQLHKPLDHRKAEAASFLRARIIIVGAHEWRADALHVFRLDADARIRNAEFQHRTAFSHHARCINGDAAAALRELHRISGEIEQDLLDGAAI